LDDRISLFWLENQSIGWTFVGNEFRLSNRMIHLNPTLRRAILSDADALYKMICGLEKTILDRSAFDFIFQRNLHNEYVAYFIAEVGDEAIGMGSCHIQTLLHHTAFVAEIQEMFVYKQYRSLQVGKALMAEIVEFAKSRGAIQLEVTSRDYRESAHRFYQREGFEKSHVKLVRYF
jgi:(aminoalkyl)phosphonate N-acetyltransferase